MWDLQWWRTFPIEVAILNLDRIEEDAKRPARILMAVRVWVHDLVAPVIHQLECDCGQHYDVNGKTCSCSEEESDSAATVVLDVFAGSRRCARLVREIFFVPCMLIVPPKVTLAM